MYPIPEDANCSAQQRAYRYIREQIMAGEFAGGEKLNPARIAVLLDISRMPVREALVQLDAEGLVTIRPNRGAIVTSLTPDDVEELFEMRAVLEALAVRLALPRLKPESFLELEMLMQRMRHARQNRRLWIQRHDEFHDYLCRQSGRTRLAGEIQRIRNAVQPYLLLYIDIYHSTEMEGAEHEALLDAARTGNGLLVERVVRDHVLTAARGVITFLRDQRTKSETQRDKGATRART